MKNRPVIWAKTCEENEIYSNKDLKEHFSGPLSNELWKFTGKVINRR